MPDVARQRASLENGGSVAPGAHKVPSQPREKGNRGAPRRGWLRTFAPARLLYGASAAMRRLDLAMRSVSVRRVVGVLGAGVALLTALSIPAGYALISYWKDAETLSLRANQSAVQVAQYIGAHGADWRKDEPALASAAEGHGLHAQPVRLRVIDLQGAVALDTGVSLASPTYARGAPIVVDGRLVGRVEAIASLQPLRATVGLLGLGSLTLGIAALFLFAVLPLRVLDRSFADLAKAGESVRRQNLLLDAALANMFQGLAMFDDDERLVIANQRFAEMYGLAPEQVRPGTPLLAILEHRVTAGLHPGETAQSLLQVMRQHLSRNKACHLAERLSQGRAILVSIRPRPEGGWVTTHQDVTERENLNAELAQQNELLRQREEQLKAQNGLLDAAVQSTYRSWSILDAALNNMSQGLAMFDTGRRLVICNRMYHELYGLSADQVRPGMSSHEVVGLRIAKGVYGEVDPDKFIDDWLAGEHDPTNRVQRLADGRIISVCRHFMADGRLVVTHEDISEREALNTRLARQNELLQQREDQLAARNQQLDAALRSMSQGLCVLDA